MVSPIDIQKALSGMDYPAKKDDVVKHAESQGGSEEVLDALKGIDDQEYDTPAAVSKAVFN
ncbi:hypothetical protein GCM10023328_28490 [Modestobacter marinus]|uniref:DUF2795 domain-containing protein n=1 Tax=Modestobacter marinus TaxID=477641 RepID=A0A846LR03_9ACTN|nr:MULTISPECIES: DUF2795 domain-containing protein [Modestobacter]MCZ2816522.1 DUF2795 domain-containing protein [Modestobacter sp. VKM Ac-2984]NIH67818.1 hypothetical protein [Modestobacter marinus]GGL70986.1 hypothetical protein GCM10011589_29210 [Modestobacter marinus]